MADAPHGIQATLFDYFQDTEYFDLQEAEEHVLQHQKRDVNRESIRARIYEGIDKGLFERVGKGLYTVTRKDEQGRENTCLLINGNGRDLSMIPDNSIDALITDHPYDTKKSLKGGNRDFASYELFQYNEQDMAEKFRVLKPGCFLVEFLPEENGDNYQYLFKVKELARKAGLEYYAKVPWKKGDFVANTGRKSKNTEDICFFTKGRARELRPDAKKDKADPSVEHFMSGTAVMLPTVLDVAAPSKRSKIHQAEKPVELLEQILRFITMEDELVLDQFAGSGALGEAALRTHRDSILIEKDLETYEKMRERISALGEVEVISVEQREAINIAIDALEASFDGSDAMMTFADCQNQSGMSLDQAVSELTPLLYANSSGSHEEEQDALQTAAEAIQAANSIEDCFQGPPELYTETEPAPESTNVLECSSLGDRRFSSIYAKITIGGKEQSIEEFYQNAKRTAEGRKAGRGKPFDHLVDPFTGDKLPASDAPDLYRGLWVTYLSRNPTLVEEAARYDKFCNKFSTKIPLTEPRHEDIISSYVKGDRERYVELLRSSHWYQNMASKKKQPSLNDRLRDAAERQNASPNRTQQISLFEQQNFGRNG